LNQLLKYIFALIAAAVTFGSFLVPDGMPDWRMPSLARIFFFHFPCSIAVTLLMFVTGYHCIRYLLTRDRTWDVKALAAQELAMIFGLLVMATGIIFSFVQWGDWWQWDPRQYSFLLVLLIYFAYFVLRASFEDPEKRARISAAYAAASILPNLFLIFIFPRLPGIENKSFHPSDTITGGLMDGDYGRTILCTLFVILTLTVWLYRLRVRAGLLELRLEEMDATSGSMEVLGGNSTATGVVRPVRVPDEG